LTLGVVRFILTGWLIALIIKGNLTVQKVSNPEGYQ